MLHSIGSALQLLGLSLMIGGLLALGAFTAPVLFSQFPREAAGQAMTIIFRRYDTVLLVAALLVLAGEGLRVFATPISWTLLSGVRSGLLLLLVLATVGSVMFLNPRMEAMQQQGVGRSEPEFGQLHQQSEKLAKLELAGAVLVLLLTPFI